MNFQNSLTGKCLKCGRDLGSGFNCVCEGESYTPDRTCLTCCMNFRACHPDYNYCPKCGKSLRNKSSLIGER